jgi:hypothetical protein
MYGDTLPPFSPPHYPSDVTALRKRMHDSRLRGWVGEGQ